MANAEAHQDVRREGILKFHSKQDFNKSIDELDRTVYKARKLRPFYVGSRCLLQNKSGTHPSNRTGLEL